MNLIALYNAPASADAFVTPDTEPVTRYGMVYQVIGQKLAIGVYGSREQVNARMLSLENHGAIAKPLTLGKPGFAYGITTREKLLAYFRYIVSLAFDIDRLDMGSIKLLEYINRQAQSMMDAIPQETFLDYGDKDREIRNSRLTYKKRHDAKLARIERKLEERRALVSRD